MEQTKPLALLSRRSVVPDKLSLRMKKFQRAIRDVLVTPTDTQYEIFRFLLILYRDDRTRFFTWPIVRNVFPREVDIIEHWMETGRFDEYPFGMGELAVLGEEEESWWWETGRFLEHNRNKEFKECMEMLLQGD